MKTIEELELLLTDGDYIRKCGNHKDSLSVRFIGRNKENTVISLILYLDDYSCIVDQTCSIISSNGTVVQICEAYGRCAKFIKESGLKV